MDVSELRKRIIHSLDEARKDAAVRRAVSDKAAAAYETFLTDIAVPLFRQAATVLRGEGHPFSVNTPSGTVRLASDHAADDFIELALDATVDPPQVVGRTSITRGRRAQIVDERPVGPNKQVANLTEDDVSKFLIEEVRRLVVR